MAETFQRHPPILKSLGSIPGPTPETETRADIVRMRHSVDLLQLRVWAVNPDGSWYATSKGLYFDLDRLPALVELVRASEKFLEAIR